MKSQSWKIVILLSLLSALSCKSKRQEPDSDLESVGFQTKALLLRKVGDTQMKPILKEGQSSFDYINETKVEFVICDRKRIKDNDFEKLINPNSCRPAFQQKSGGRDLILSLTYENLERIKRNTGISKNFWEAINFALTGVRFGGAIFIASAAAGAGATVGAVGGPVGIAVGGVSGFVKGTLAGSAWILFVGGIQGQTTNKWKMTDDTVSKYFKGIFDLDGGRNMFNASTSVEFGYILKWIEHRFNADLKEPYKQYGTGDYLKFD